MTMKTTDSNFSPRSTFYAALVLVAIAAAVCLSGCARSPQVNANANAAGSPSQKKAVAELSKPFNLGQKSFDSQLRFVEEIRPRCATEEPPPAQRRQLELRIESLRESFPEE